MEHAVICLLFVPLLMQDAQRQQDSAFFRADAKFITVDVQVLLHDKPLLGLTKNDFQVFDDGEAQTITNLGFDEAPLDIMLLLDLSGSTDKIAAEIQEQSVEAMRHLRRQDRVGLAVFAWAAFLAVPITASREQLEAGIHNKSWRKSVPRWAPTELNASTLNTAEYLQDAARRGARRAIIVLTDNQGMAAVSDAKVREGLWEADVLLSAIFYHGSEDWYEHPADLNTFVKATGLRWHGASRPPADAPNAAITNRPEGVSSSLRNFA